MPKGSHSFTRDELTRIGELLDARSRADPVAQKRLRDQLRKLNFYISDFAMTGGTSADLTHLVKVGTITVSEGTVSHEVPRPSAPETRRSDQDAGGPPVQALVVAAVGDLIGSADSVLDGSVPTEPGLYAIDALPAGPLTRAEVWSALGVGPPREGAPLYIGKAESSLRGRDVRGHFGVGTNGDVEGSTGYSTVRRTFAALLAGALDLHAQPRNLAAVGHYDKYAFPPEEERRLSVWMISHLGIRVWPHQQVEDLERLETEVLRLILPPLNILKIKTPFTIDLRAARKRQADVARRWRTTG